MNRALTGVCVLGLTALVAATSGCGFECAEGTQEVNGVCVAPTGPDRCGPGTREVDGECVLIPEEDMGPGNDVVEDVTKDVATDMTADAGDMCPGPSMCGKGTEFVAETCSCRALDLPPVVEVTEVSEQPVVTDALGGSFVREGDGVALYWTSIAAGDNLQLRRQRVNTKTLQLEGESEIVSVTQQNAISPAASADGLWLIWSCRREDHGLEPRGTFDLCIASRPDTNSEWENVRVLTEIPTIGGAGSNTFVPADQPSTSPDFVSGPGGAPVGIVFSSLYPVGKIDLPDICVASFDATTGEASYALASGVSCDDGEGNPDRAACMPTFELCDLNTLTCAHTACLPLQANYALPPGQNPPEIPIAEFTGTETAPTWSADGTLLAFGKTGESVLGATESLDIWLARSSQANGVIDEFLGRLSISGPGNQTEPSIAPDGSNAIVWTEIADTADFTQGSVLRLGRLNPP